VCLAGISLPYTPLGAGLDMAAMPVRFLPWLLGIVLLQTFEQGDETVLVLVNNAQEPRPLRLGGR